MAFAAAMSSAVWAQRLGELAAIDFGLQFAGWGVSSFLQTEKFYDVTGSLTFWAMILRSRSYVLKDESGKDSGKGLSLRQQICSLCVLAWSARLGLFLAKRAYQHGDSRFDKVKTKPGLFLVYWMVQGIWCFLTALPVYLSLSQPRVDASPTGLVDYCSWGGWLLGFVIEVLADMQKSGWKAAGNRGFTNCGVWKYSQHPNYFGEMLLWVSLCASCIKGLGFSLAPKVAALASPAFVCYLLRYVSGVPLLQKASMAKYGTDPQYLAYIARTNLLAPWFPK